MKILEMIYHAIFRPCPFHQVTGYYCPGCGGTRSVIALLRGHIIQSFIYHPIVLYVVILTIYALCIKLLDIIKAKDTPRFVFHPKYVYIALFILLINFLIKNTTLYFGLDLLNL